MKTIINMLLAGIVSGAVLTSCSKSAAMNDLRENSQTLAAKQGSDLNTNGSAKQGSEQVGEVSILNQDLGIVYASDGGANITAQFSDFTFNFTGTYPSGIAHVWNDLLAQTGKWSMEDKTNEFVIWYPTNIFTQLAFLNRSWTIAEGSSSVIRLTAADGDEVHFAAK